MNLYFAIVCFFISLVDLVHSDILSVVQNCTNPHEYYACGGPCKNECLTLGEPCLINNFRCNDWCYCEPGYARNKLDICIPEWQCSNHKEECLGENEVFKCGTACQNTCARLNEPCPILNKKCNNGCFCKPGYARDPTYICIPEEECIVPQEPCKDLNEVYTCGFCDPDCKSIGECKISADASCRRGCYCRTGYVRGTNRECVQESSCYASDKVDA